MIVFMVFSVIFASVGLANMLSELSSKEKSINCFCAAIYFILLAIYLEL